MTRVNDRPGGVSPRAPSVPAYGEKRDYRKIDLYVQVGESDGYRYVGTTTWAPTCREAKARFIEANPHLKPVQVKAMFS